MLLPKSELDAIKKTTGNFYDKPPSYWVKAFWQGSAADAPKFSPADRVVMRWLYRSSQWNPKEGAFILETSYRGAAKILELERETIAKSVKRLEALGAIGISRQKNRLLIRVLHLKESGANWDFY